jgi:GxxExxY protein
MKTEILFKDESYKIIGACFEVYNGMGNGFLEAVYQECLRKEFRIQRIPFIEKPKLEIFYKNDKLEQYYEPDFLCYNEIILEIKAVKTLNDEHKAQVINYLKATGKRLGLLVNFGHFAKMEQERLLN